MPDMSDITKSVVSEEERKRLIGEIGRIKDVLDSFKYGLNFEDFADELFKAIDRQTIAVRKLETLISDVLNRMEALEKRLDEGVKIHIAGISEDMKSSLSEDQEVVIESSEPSTNLPSEKESLALESTADLEMEAADLEIKIAKLFEKENDLAEMAMNDPAGAEEYDEKAGVARDMRKKYESRLKEIKQLLG